MTRATAEDYTVMISLTGGLAVVMVEDGKIIETEAEGAIADVREDVDTDRYLHDVSAADLQHHNSSDHFQGRHIIYFFDRPIPVLSTKIVFTHFESCVALVGLRYRADAEETQCKCTSLSNLS